MPGAAYNRNDLLGSMRATVEAPKPSGAGDSGTSADNTTTAGAKAAEEKAAATAGAEGGESSADEKDGSDASGSQETESDGTTAEEGDGTSSEEQALEEEGDGEESEEGDEPDADKKPEPASGKWDEEEQKAAKEWGLESLKPTAETKKLLKIARDNQKAVQEHKQQIAVHNDYLATLGNTLVNHDIENLNAIVAELGGEKIPFDVRTEEDQIKEVSDGFNAAYDALAGAKLSPEVWAQVQEALAPLHEKAKTKVALLERKMSERQMTEKVLKDLGHTPVKGTYTKGLKDKADKNFITLVKDDPKAEAHMKILEPFFKSGMVLQNPSKAYANAPKEVNELGRALYFMRNFQKEFLPEITKNIEASLKLKRIGKPPPSGNKGDSLGAGDPPTPKSVNRKQNHFVAQRMLARFGKGR